MSIDAAFLPIAKYIFKYLNTQIILGSGLSDFLLSFCRQREHLSVGLAVWVGWFNWDRFKSCSKLLLSFAVKAKHKPEIVKLTAGKSLWNSNLLRFCQLSWPFTGNWLENFFYSATTFQGNQGPTKPLASQSQNQHLSKEEKLLSIFHAVNTFAFSFSDLYTKS